MRLVKFCRPEHNITRGSNLRLGTLYSYRSIERASLRDEGEGSFTLRISFPGETKVPNEVADIIFHKIRFGDVVRPRRDFPTFVSRIKNLEYVGRDAAHVYVRDTHIEMEIHFPNCFIYCMSTEDSSLVVSPFVEYQDYWTVNLGDADSFVRLIVVTLAESITLSSFITHIAEDHQMAGSPLNFHYGHGRVRYVKDREIIINKPTFEESDLRRVLCNAPFLKPYRFHDEREYRFVIFVSYHSIIVQPAVDHVLLHSGRLASCAGSARGC